MKSKFANYCVLLFVFFSCSVFSLEFSNLKLSLEQKKALNYLNDVINNGKVIENFDNKNLLTAYEGAVFVMNEKDISNYLPSKIYIF